MRCLALFAALFALAPFSAAVTLVLDSPLTVERPKYGSKGLDVTGTLTTGGAVSSASLVYSPATMTATERITGVNINGALLSGLDGGSFTGVLFTLTINATTKVGTYLGSAQFRVKIGRATYLSNVEGFTVKVKEYAAAVPEPAAMVALSVGVLGLTRRRRR